VLRAARDHIGAPGFRTRQGTRVTTLLDAQPSRVADLAARYRQRWQGETSRAQLQTTMPMAVWHGTTVSGVRKELTVLASVDHLGRLGIWHSAMRQHRGVARSSGLEARRWLGAPGPGSPAGAWVVNPVRPHRVQPRVKKRRPKRFPVMMNPRHALRQQLLQPELTS
jgi:hypothetical protein